jgi:hypothetical protein
VLVDSPAFSVGNLTSPAAIGLDPIKHLFVLTDDSLTDFLVRRVIATQHLALLPAQPVELLAVQHSIDRFESITLLVHDFGDIDYSVHKGLLMGRSLRLILAEVARRR